MAVAACSGEERDRAYAVIDSLNLPAEMRSKLRARIAGKPAHHAEPGNP